MAVRRARTRIEQLSRVGGGDDGRRGNGRHPGHRVTPCRPATAGSSRFRAGRRENGEMTKSELIERIAQRQSQLVYRDVELAVKTILEHMAGCLAGGGRIEIRGFGSFSLHFRSGRVGRNPKTGTPVSLPAKYVPHFKPGKRLRERVNWDIRLSLEAQSRPDIDPDPTPGRSASEPSPAYGHGYTSSGGSSSDV